MNNIFAFIEAHPFAFLLSGVVCFIIVFINMMTFGRAKFKVFAFIHVVFGLGLIASWMCFVTSMIMMLVRYLQHS